MGVKKNRVVAIEDAKKSALFELWISLLFLVSFTLLDLAFGLIEPLYAFMTTFYGSVLTASLIHFSFLLMTVLLWLVYRRWKGVDQIISELENILSSMHSHVLLVIDADRTIRGCSRSIKKMFGYEMDEVVNQKTDCLFQDQAVQDTPSGEIQEMLEQKGFHVRESLGKKKNGETIPIEVITGKLANKPGTVLLLRDIAERKHLEEELLQHHKLEALGRMAGGIAHDYNNFMTVISGFAKLIKRRMPPSDPLHSELDELLKASDRAISLTRRLLAFGRRQTMHPRILNLNEVVLGMNKLLTHLLGEGIELQTKLSDSLRPIKANASQMEQVLLNLVLNAQNAMPHGGRIIIETHNFDHIRLSYRPQSGFSSLNPGDYVLLRVIDNGIGMSEEVKKHLSEPFFTTSEERNGVGLGLAICYGIVKANHGEISVSSESGKGTTVHVYFSCVEGLIEKETGTTEPEKFSRGTETILLTEDEAQVRAFASEVLKEQGYQVIEASNGQEALRAIKEDKDKKIKLVLTDLMMPRMGGEELVPCHFNF